MKNENEKKALELRLATIAKEFGIVIVNKKEAHNG